MLRVPSGAEFFLCNAVISELPVYAHLSSASVSIINIKTLILIEKLIVAHLPNGVFLSGFPIKTLPLFLRFCMSATCAAHPVDNLHLNN
jgi:hypothetical protein